MFEVSNSLFAFLSQRGLTSIKKESLLNSPF